MGINKGASALWYCELSLHQLGSRSTVFIPRWTTHSSAVLPLLAESQSVWQISVDCDGYPFEFKSSLFFERESEFIPSLCGNPHSWLMQTERSWIITPDTFVCMQDHHFVIIFHQFALYTDGFLLFSSFLLLAVIVLCRDPPLEDASYHPPRFISISFTMRHQHSNSSKKTPSKWTAAGFERIRDGAYDKNA